MPEIHNFYCNATIKTLFFRTIYKFLFIFLLTENTREYFQVYSLQNISYTLKIKVNYSSCAELRI